MGGSRVPIQRGYRQGCGVARGLDLVGERWALLIVRELLLGPKRFTDLRAGLPGASPNALTDRLRELSDAGVLLRRKLPPPSASWVYELTAWGRDLEPIVLALGTWALRADPSPEQTFVSLDSLMLTLRTYYSEPGSAVPGPSATLRVRLRRDGDSDEQVFGVWLREGAADIRHQEPDHPDATITTDIETLMNALGAPDELATIPNDRLDIEGDPAVIRRLLAGIRLPEPPPIEKPATRPHPHPRQ